MGWGREVVGTGEARVQRCLIFQVRQRREAREGGHGVGERDDGAG